MYKGGNTDKTKWRKLRKIKREVERERESETYGRTSKRVDIETGRDGGRVGIWLEEK